MRSNHRADTLTEAINVTDLPGLIHEFYPDSRAKSNREGVIFAAWRGNENTPAVSLSKVNGRWLWKDHATDEGGSAFEWLVQARGMDRQEAATFLVERAGLATPEAPGSPSSDSKAHKYRPLPPDAVAAFLELPVGVVPAMSGRGFTPQLVEHYGIRSDNNADALIPITNPEGVIMQVKRRLNGVTGSGKYKYEHTGYGGPAWCSLGSRKTPTLLIVEGECLPGEAEILTPSGWQRLDAYDGSPILQHNDNGTGEFVQPLAHIAKPFDGELVEWRSKGFASITTPGHRLIAYDGHGRLIEAPAGEGHMQHRTIPRVVNVSGPGIQLSPTQIALAIAVSADGHIYQPHERRFKRAVRIGVAKRRKIERLTTILNSLNIPYQEGVHPSHPNIHNFTFAMPKDIPLFKLFPWEWIAQATGEQQEFILAELVHWDGNSVPDRNQHEYSSKEYHNASWVQTLAHVAGRVSTIMPRSNSLGSWYKVSILHGKRTSSWQALRANGPTYRHHKGLVYCVQVPSGRILVRQEDRITVTGNCNGIIAHAALQSAGHTDIGVLGMAGANTPLYPGVVAGKRVLVYADDDEAGENARAAWALAAHEAGARSVHTMIPHSEDFCDVAGKHGLPALTEMLDAMRASAEQVYGAADRLLGTATVKEVMETTRRFLEGGVLHGTGFTDVDRQTGGIREAGIYSVAALSSMGKSSVARRMWLQHVKEGGIVRVYSPDQSATSIYRLITNLLSGVGMEEIRTRNYSEAAIKLWGSAEAAKAAWWEVYEWVLTELSQKLQVSEESRVQEIVKDMEKAADEGVTMFGIDYMQMIRPRGDDGDGAQSTELMAMSRRLVVPIVSTLQLAKYKFPPNRVNGLPVPGDIQGAGAYFQDSEMVFMVHNEEIYAAKYAGENWQSEGDSPGEARLILRKDKEGRGDNSWHIRWDARLAAYSNAGMFDLNAERKGLI